uniref:Uncharacterized protein n=1 Tax=Magallana gigas TaxID=29159 RepID=A0A8W8KZU2_MAGGI
MLHHLTTTTSIYQAGLSEDGNFFSILDNGDQALQLKQHLRFIHDIVKSTMQAIVYKTCDLFRKTKPHKASKTYGSDSAFKPVRLGEVSKFGEDRTSNSLDTGPAPKTLTSSGRRRREYSISSP